MVEQRGAASGADDADQVDADVADGDASVLDPAGGEAAQPRDLDVGDRFVGQQRLQRTQPQHVVEQRRHQVALFGLVELGALLGKDVGYDLADLAGQFGARSANNVRSPVLTVNGTVIETFFESEGSPAWGGYQSEPIVRLIELARQARSVRFMAFVLTRDDLMTAMAEQAGAGALDVRGVVESSQRRYITTLFCAGLDVRQDGNPDILHHKVFIFDDTTVALGSFNFTSSAANDNDENMLIIHNRDVARAFLEEFERRWAEATPLPAESYTC